jgi:hypothetical protein
MDLSRCKGRTQVTMEEYDEFIRWYKKRCNIRVLKIKDMVNTRYVKDKKTKETVCEEHIKGFDMGYLIYDNFYKEWKECS